MVIKNNLQVSTYLVPSEGTNLQIILINMALIAMDTDVKGHFNLQPKSDPSKIYFWYLICKIQQ